MRESLLERLSLDGDRRELREQEEDLLVLLVGQARLGAEHVECAQYRAAVAGDDRHRPRRVEAVRVGDVTEVDPAIVARDIADVDRLAQERGGSARSGRRRHAEPFEHV